VLNSVLDAIKSGQWDFEPTCVDDKKYTSTSALPGTNEKLAILAERVRMGLPLWHPSDRRDWEDPVVEA
jgi:hypothetical protein